MMNAARPRAIRQVTIDILLSTAFLALSAVSDLAAQSRPNHLQHQTKVNAYSDLVGRYGRGETDVLYFQMQEGQLTARPAFWRSGQPLEVKNDSFVVAERRERGGYFVRDSLGEVIEATIFGFSDSALTYEKIKRSGRLPVELLFEGKGKEAYAELSKRCGYYELLDAGKAFFELFPTRARVAVEYLGGLVEQFGDSSDAYILQGRAYVAAHMRPLAEASFRKALTLNHGKQTAQRYLIRLHAEPVPPEIEAAQWKTPFSLSELFRPPTQMEIEKVRRMWATRDLSPVELKEVAQGTIRFGKVDVLVRVVSHKVHGSLHYGAIISPAGARKNSCAVVIEAKGVSWDYFPLDINTGLNAPRILGPDLSHFIIIAPCLRGEKMIFNGKEFTSEGDRTDGWDGATDDALSLLNVALESTPAADSTRIFSFGRSRGGSVAMLAAERDGRIKGVVEWAGPADWFELMGEQGWTQQELVEEGLRIHAKPDETAGQFIERYLLKPIDKTRDLEMIRLGMIASSPLYFVSTLPSLQIDHGVEDNSVPIANARALAESLKKTGRSGHNLEAYFYEGSGHDTDVQLATKRSHKFLQERSKPIR